MPVTPLNVYEYVRRYAEHRMLVVAEQPLHVSINGNFTEPCVNADQCFVIYQNVYSHRLSFIGNEEGLARCTAQERLRGLDS